MTAAKRVPPPYKGTPLELRCVNTIRALSADQPEAANSGHPGAPMGCAPMAFLLWTDIMKYSASNPKWWNRDRFVLSNGHACALQYSMLHLTGYDLSIEDLKQFRKLGSKTPGHPENITAGVEVCTGPLGQGISNAVGLALAERHMAANYNESGFDIFDNYTYVICGDGCLQEGISSEACSLAGHLGLGKLLVFYDDNMITIDGETELSFTEDVKKRYEAYGWHVQVVDDLVNQLDDLREAVKNAKAETDKPSMIVCKTLIGHGSPSKEGLEIAHGAPLGTDELRGAKEYFGLPPDEMFHVPDDVKEYMKAASSRGEQSREAWEALFEKYKAKFPEKAKDLERRFKGDLPEGVFDDIPKFIIGKDKDKASRKMSQACLEAITPKMKELVGGSADLTPSNCTWFKEAKNVKKGDYEGRYFRFGVREHGMGAITNGVFAYGGLRPFCATFLTFFGYMAGAIRVAALSRFGILYILTHDSIGLGEDGPTHQPIETLESLRSIPNINVFRPADQNEMNAAYESALTTHTTPTVVACSRQTLQALEGSSVEKAKKGAYVAVDVDSPALILVATGSEVGPCVNAAKALTESGTPTRVVSMPCQEIFLQQSTEYQKSVLPGNIPTLSVEASSPHGWHRFAHSMVSMNSFGISARGTEALKHFGFTDEHIKKDGQALVDFYKKAGTVPDLSLRPPIDVILPPHDYLKLKPSD